MACLPRRRGPGVAGGAVRRGRAGTSLRAFATRSDFDADNRIRRGEQARRESQLRGCVFPPLVNCARAEAPVRASCFRQGRYKPRSSPRDKYPRRAPPVRLLARRTPSHPPFPRLRWFIFVVSFRVAPAPPGRPARFTFGLSHFVSPLLDSNFDLARLTRYSPLPRARARNSRRVGPPLSRISCSTRLFPRCSPPPTRSRRQQPPALKSRSMLTRVVGYLFTLCGYVGYIYI
jgi:hypothetical protein